MFKQPALLLSAAALALGVAACGGGSSSSSAAAGGGTTSAATSSAATSSSATSGTGTSAGTGTSSAAAGGGSSNLSIAANSSGSLAYDKKTLDAKAGKVTITMTNMSPVGHNITVQKGTNGAVLGATPTFQGGTKSVSVNLKPGKYTFYCSVPGHRAGGMVGTLTVS